MFACNSGVLRQPTHVSYPDHIYLTFHTVKKPYNMLHCGQTWLKNATYILIVLFDCSGLLASVRMDNNLSLSDRGGDIAMHGSSNKCHIMLKLYTLDKVTLRLCKIYFSLRSNPA